MYYLDAVQSLTVKEIVRAIGMERLTRVEKRNREQLLMAIAKSDSFQEAVLNAYEEKRLRVQDERREHVKRCKITETIDVEEVSEEFLQDVGDHGRDEALSSFVECTGNAALQGSVCVVCAGEYFKTKTRECDLAQLHHKELLLSSHPHPRHRVIMGMLLHDVAVYERHGRLYGAICDDCYSDITCGKLPIGALANNMWVGDVPPELSILSLPERVLISRYFAAAYVVKLYPRAAGKALSSSGSEFNSGLRGNVSSYRLNTSDVSSMVEGNLLPHHPNVLPATIGITVVGPNNVPVKSLPRLLNVSRHRVQQALVFLRDNNPFYRDIQISDRNLSFLPDDAIPTQLATVIRELKNSTVLDEEHGGYVPDDDDDEVDEVSTELINESDGDHSSDDMHAGTFFDVSFGVQALSYIVFGKISVTNLMLSLYKRMVSWIPAYLTSVTLKYLHTQWRTLFTARKTVILFEEVGIG